MFFEQKKQCIGQLYLMFKISCRVHLFAYFDHTIFATLLKKPFKQDRDHVFESGVNFINVLQAAFTRANPECIKLSIFFTLLGSTSVKSACKTLVKSRPVLNFINVLGTAFTLADPESVKIYL